MKGFPHMSPDKYEALLKIRQRRQHALGQVEQAAWLQAQANARAEALSALMDYIHECPYRVFYSERAVLPPHFRERMEDEQIELEERIARFEQQGKTVHQLTEMYIMAGHDGWRRVVVEVDGQAYGWYKYWTSQWLTGDRLKGIGHGR